MKTLHFNISMLLALGMSGLGAGGCSNDGADSVTGTDHGGGGFVTITLPSDPRPSTVCNSAFLAGSAFISPTWSSCCSGSAEEVTGVTVTWRNETTGTSGKASQIVSICDFLGYPYPCDHSWSATIPLALGDNLITVTATDRSGRTGQRSITVNKPVPSYSISGKVANQRGIGLWGYGESGIKIALAGAGTSTYQYSEKDGSYSFSCIVSRSYDLMPSSSINYAFSPLARTVAVTDADVTEQDFSAEAYLVSGNVTHSGGLGVEGALITLTGANLAVTYRTDDGSYLFLLPNGTYTIEPSYCLFGCVSFTPASRTVTVDDTDVPGQDFTATAPTSTTRAPPARAAR